MRIVASVLVLVFLAVTPFPQLPAQEAKSKPNSKLSSSEIWNRLNLQVSTKPLNERMTFKEVLDYVNISLATNKTSVPIQVTDFVVTNADGKRQDRESPMTMEVSIRLDTSHVTVARLLQLATSQLRIEQSHWTFTVRSGGVEIAPAEMLSQEALSFYPGQSH